MQNDSRRNFEFADAIEDRLNRLQSGQAQDSQKKVLQYESFEQDTDESQAAIFSHTEELAALSGAFDPVTLLPESLSETEKKDELKRLELYCIVQTDNDSLRWTLSSSRRTEILNSILESGRLAEFKSTSLPLTDPVGVFIRKLLFSENIDLALLGQGDLLALSAAMESLTDIKGIDKPDLNDIKNRIATRNFLEDYEVLLRDGFVGRQKELEKLKKFITDPSPAPGVIDSIVLTGTGGSGKTTLLAQLIQDITRESTATISILDFDKPGIDPTNDYWREQEITRQIGYQYPDIRSALHNLRDEFRKARHNIEQAADHSSERVSQSRAYSNILYEVPAQLKKIKADKKPFVIILDTFEEVLQQNAFGRMVEWFYIIGDKMRPLTIKFILSGRAMEEGSFSGLGTTPVKPVKVEEFDKKQTAEFLETQKVNPVIIPQIIAANLMPHRPLELKLLARVINNGDATIDELKDEFAHTKKSVRHLFLGLIYKRVLDRIKDEHVQALAYPGLVLRYITPELISSVLVPVLRMKNLKNLDPLSVLNDLANYGWLATRGDNNEVYHRKDLRQTMLRLIIAQEPRKARKISEAAIRYFENRPEEKERAEAEALYHRLLLGDEPKKTNEIDLRRIKALSSFLMTDASDLPKAARVLFDYTTTGKIQPEDFYLLPDKEVSRAYHKMGRRLVEANNFLKAYQLYKRFLRLRDKSKPQTAWEIEAIIATANWKDLERIPNSDGMILSSPHVEVNTFAINLYQTIFSKPSTKELWLLEEIWDDWISHVSKRKRVLDQPGAVLDLSQMADFFMFYEKRFFDSNKKKKFLLFAIGQLQKLHKTIPISCQRSLIRLDWKRFLDQEKLYLHSTQLKLDPEWLLQFRSRIIKMTAASRPGYNLLRGIHTKLTKNVFKQMSSVKNLLSIVDSVKLKGKFNAYIPFKYIEIEPKLLRGPDPEFRNPIRYAILEAFRTQSDFKKLLKLIRKNCFVTTDDMEEEKFVNQMLANREEALVPFIELVDRSWKLKSFLAGCRKLKPTAKKLSSVMSLYTKWDNVITKRLK